MTITVLKTRDGVVLDLHEETIDCATVAPLLKAKGLQVKDVVAIQGFSSTVTMEPGDFWPSLRKLEGVGVQSSAFPAMDEVESPMPKLEYAGSSVDLCGSVMLEALREVEGTIYIAQGAQMPALRIAHKNLNFAGENLPSLVAVGGDIFSSSDVVLDSLKALRFVGGIATPFVANALENCQVQMGCNKAIAAGRALIAHQEAMSSALGGALERMSEDATEDSEACYRGLSL